ncbi:MAG: TetR/AcrR family transcriptional regulator [Pseudomonadota bacterium]
MPRKPSRTRDQVIDAAMRHFWRRGYHATSIDDLIETVGVSRHTLYSAIGGKHEVYLRCFDVYQDAVVTPAFEKVEDGNATLDAIAEYFEKQIALAAAQGLPGPGCLVANAATETAPHDALAAQKVQEHHHRLKTGFAKVLLNAAPQLSAADRSNLADFLVTSAQGLWSMSRTVHYASALREQASLILSLIELRCAQ